MVLYKKYNKKYNINQKTLIIIYMKTIILTY
jgi:hypothetical protein